MTSSSKIVVALDVPTKAQALDLARSLRGEVAAYKVGLELANAVGLDIFDQIQEVAGPHARIFYDCKFHDIPNTVAGATRAAARRGLWMLNVHASGGSAMMRAAVAAARDSADAAGRPRPLVIAVTVLTSIDAPTLAGEIGVRRAIEEQVVHLAILAQQSGCDGVVASPREIAAIRDACGSNFVLVIPGVRPSGSDIGDQKRVMTPGEAVLAGADYIVVGRPITAAPDPVEAARAINAEVAGVGQG